MTAAWRPFSMLHWAFSPPAQLRRRSVHPKPQPKVVPAQATNVARPAPERRAVPRAGGISWLPPLISPRHDRLLVYALAASIAVHAVALAIRFRPFDIDRLFDRGPPLEVALVNATSKAKPTKPDILAQANLDGGGNTDADRRAKTPLPVLPKESRETEAAVATQKVEVLERQARDVLTQREGTPVPAPAAAPVEVPERVETPTAQELMQRTLEAMRLEAQIAKEMDAYQKRPKRRFVGAQAEEYRFARYVEDWRLKIERVGNLNYPEAARQLKLYGNLLLTVSIRADGSVENVRIERSSGQRVLDAAAVKIVEMSAPFAPLPPDIRRDTDILHITRTWTFTKGDELRSE